jgi:heme exporter protein A
LKLTEWCWRPALTIGPRQRLQAASPGKGKGRRKLLPLPLREGVGGRGSACEELRCDAGTDRSPNLSPLRGQSPQRKGEKISSLLQAHSLAAFRGERLIFRDLDFTVAAGGALLLAGPNGSGKSTLLRLLAGLGRLAAGRLLWAGEDALADLTAHASRVAYVGHLDAVKPGLTASENLHFAAHVGGGQVGQALEALGLHDLADLPARMLSAGQKRRLALARLVLSPAPLWLLDEPTLGLDAASVERFGVVLAGHRARGGIIVAATHLPLPLASPAELRLA